MVLLVRSWRRVTYRVSSKEWKLIGRPSQVSMVELRVSTGPVLETR